MKVGLPAGYTTESSPRPDLDSAGCTPYSNREEMNIMDEREQPALTCFDTREHWRCPILGGPVHFSYCRAMNGGLPCHRVLGCWNGKLDIQTYLQDHFTPEQLDRVFSQPAPGRMGTIFEALRRVREQNPHQE